MSDKGCAAEWGERASSSLVGESPGLRLGTVECESPKGHLTGFVIKAVL